MRLQNVKDEVKEIGRISLEGFIIVAMILCSIYAVAVLFIFVPFCFALLGIGALIELAGRGYHVLYRKFTGHNGHPIHTVVDIETRRLMEVESGKSECEHPYLN